MKHNILMQMEQETFVTLRVRVWIETDPDIYSIVFEVSPSA